METEVFVYVDIAGTPHLAGRLWARVRKGRESATFEYHPDWLEYADRFSLEPALTLGPGPFYTPSGKPLLVPSVTRPPTAGGGSANAVIGTSFALAMAIVNVWHFIGIHQFTHFGNEPVDDLIRFVADLRLTTISMEYNGR